ncbi:hypothetical protein [Actinomadura macra]|uniref:hypothetical protein n=1 Tax=Actinomadura macra TaxID=46164 RepID=UPI0008326CED|nr:hypothetical protein [Actinomadura macra]
MIRISAAIMHHPRRAHRIPSLLRACAPLAPTVVPDPEPEGKPSPLRTAKRAWAAIDDDATHHLVLQDDVRLAPGFAAQLHDAVARRPAHGVSSFCLWHTPHNSYLVRRAAVAGAAYAPLSLYEWTPTQAFVLPVEHARALADYLAGIPDEVQDDDEMVVIFCRERGIPVVTTVPHLMDHGHAESLVEGHSDGLRATVFAPDLRWPADHPSADLELPPGAYTVALQDSVCSIRLMHGDPVEHEFGWYWYDACPLAGVDPEEVLDAGAPHLSGLPARAASAMTEVWAACYLLGVDVARSAPSSTGCGPLMPAAVESWIDQGLTRQDHRELREDCVRLALAAVRQGMGERKFADAS